MLMTDKRKKFSPEGKVRLLRLHPVEKEPVSGICDRHGLNPIAVGRRFTAVPFYEFQRQFKALLCLKKPEKLQPYS